MSWEKYEPDMLSIYRESFTQAEVNELIAFYQSAVGRNFASKSPQIAQKSMAVSLHPGPATAGVVSPACASGSIVTRRAYNTSLRGPGELER